MNILDAEKKIHTPKLLNVDPAFMAVDCVSMVTTNDTRFPLALLIAYSSLGTFAQFAAALVLFFHRFCCLVLSGSLYEPFFAAFCRDIWSAQTYIWAE